MAPQVAEAQRVLEVRPLTDSVFVTSYLLSCTSLLQAALFLARNL